jgi:tetratricopeptide (TPR) repeat protein
MGYLPYYLVWMVAAYALQHPVLLVGVVVVFVARRWIPDPYLWLKHARRVHALKAQIAQNPDNVTARRDLAVIHLEKRRPRRAIRLLEEARRRDGESAELAFLLGKALHAAGRDEEALPLLVESAQKNEKLHYGEAYLVAGRALDRLKRFDEAEDALLRYLDVNSSSVDGRVRLALVRRERRDDAGARAALDEALETWAHLPRFRRRHERRAWMRAQLLRVAGI